MLWTYDPPDDTVMSLTPGRVMFYFPGLNQAKVIHLSSGDDPRGASPLGFGMGGGIEEMKDRFVVTVNRNADSTEVIFVPREENEESGIEKMLIRVDDDFMPVGSMFFETGGDVTELVFKNQETNFHLEADAFEIELPSDTSVETIGAGE
jgi:outer membrane lipoprotein-sorting protein